MASLNRFDLVSRGLAADANPNDVYRALFENTFLKLLRQENVPKIEWQSLFSEVYGYVIWYNDKEVHNVPQVIFENLRLNAVQTVTNLHNILALEHDDQLFLQLYNRFWREFHFISLNAHLPFRTVDEALLEEPDFATAMKTDDIGPIRRMLMKVWHESVLTPFAKRLLNIVSELLIVERDEGLVYDDLITGVRDTFFCVTADSSYFNENYGSVYIATLERYYIKAARQQFDNGSVVDYARWAEKTFHDEQIRAKKYFVPSSKYTQPIQRTNDRLIELVLKESRIFEALTQTAFRLVEERRSEPLAVIYRLLDRVAGGLEPVVGAVQAFIIRKGKEDMMESGQIVANDPEKYVEKLLHLYNMFAELVNDAFSNDHRFTSARDRGFIEVVNDASVFSLQIRGRSALPPESRCPEMLANFCDSLLRKTNISRRLVSEEISVRLQSTLQILKYVINKDIFMQCYQATLARRLILRLSVDSDIEEELCRWLANLGMPAEVINRMTRMFGDIRVSEDLTEAWTDYALEREWVSKVGELDLKILNVCSWSRSPGERTACTISPDIEEFLTEFEKWYCGKFQGRKLVLTGSSSTMVLQFTSNQGQYDLEVTMFQNAVLNAFKDCSKSKLTFEAIRTATAIPYTELRKTLWTLCTLAKCGNCLLGHAPHAASLKDFDQSSRFWVNMNFAPVRNGKPQKRGRINLIGKLQVGGTGDRAEEDHDGISALRELRVQEAVTKVMKARKTATMTEIHMEAIELLKNLFLPNRKTLKEQIEFLIEKDYLTRDERDLNVFHYQA